MAKIRTVGDARRVWQRFGLAWSGGLPDYLFENAEALIKFEEKHAQELTTARQAAVQDAYTWRHLDKLKPPDDTVCLVTDEGLQPCVARYIASADYFVGQFRGYNPRWWLPIPMSPAVEAGKEGKE